MPGRHRLTRPWAVCRSCGWKMPVGNGWSPAWYGQAFICNRLSCRISGWGGPVLLANRYPDGPMSFDYSHGVIGEFERQVIVEPPCPGIPAGQRIWLDGRWVMVSPYPPSHPTDGRWLHPALLTAARMAGRPALFHVTQA